MDRVCILGIFLLIMVTADPATALFPYRNRYGDLWDALVDPVNLFGEQIAVAKDVEAVALARIDWKETPTKHVFAVDVPGMKKEEIKIEVEEKRVLKISGERVKEEEKQSDKWHKVERICGKFWRQFKLPANADMDGISASLENGVLTVNVPKIGDEEVKSSKIVGIVETGERTAVQ